MALIIKQHDRRPYVVVQLQQPPGTPVDLTAATSVTMVMRRADLVGQPGTRLPCSVTDALNGWVRHVWGAGETDMPGDYNVEFEVLWGTEPQTFPTDTYYSITIRDDLDD